MKRRRRVVLTYGTFDMFHIGHLNLLKRAKKLGDYLIVGVSTDEFNALKGKRAFMPYEHRAEIVSSIKYVDKVIPETRWEQKIEDVKKYGVDVFVMGNDWKGKCDFLKDYCEVIYLQRTEGISSTELREQFSYQKGFDDAKREDVVNLRKELNLSPEKIAKILKLPEEKVREYLEEEKVRT